MATTKQYASPDAYEAKLARVMERMGADQYNYNWDRHMAWVEFRLKGQLYRFDHSVEKAKARGFKLTYGSDVFAQLVIAPVTAAAFAEVILPAIRETGCKLVLEPGRFIVGNSGLLVSRVVVTKSTGGKN